MKNITCAIAGVTGYTGRELLRLLLEHPQCEVTAMFSHSKAGITFSKLYPQFSCWADHTLKSLDALADCNADVLFLALPHGSAAENVARIHEAGFSGKIIDLSADFRIADKKLYEATYGKAHPCPELLGDFIYGLTELDHPKINKADRVANPGCFASTLQMLTAPVAEAGYDQPMILTGMTGSTGSGASPSATTHHPERYGNLKAYKVLEHRHMAEARQRLHEINNPPEILFTPVSAPVARGIWMTATFANTTNLDVAGIYRKAYADQPLVRLTDGLPQLREVVDTPLTLLGIHDSGTHVVAGIAIDNLLKGAALNTVQIAELL